MAAVKAGTVAAQLLTDAEMTTPLHCAVEARNAEACARLVAEVGLGVNDPNGKGQTALLLAARQEERDAAATSTAKAAAAAAAAAAHQAAEERNPREDKTAPAAAAKDSWAAVAAPAPGQQERKAGASPTLTGAEGVPSASSAVADPAAVANPAAGASDAAIEAAIRGARPGVRRHRGIGGGAPLRPFPVLRPRG